MRDVDENVQFETGDPEIDDLEKRISEGNITDEEITATIESWEQKKKPQPVEEPQEFEFNDNYPRR